MVTPNNDENMRITRNTSISIGLGVTFLIGVWFTASSFTTMQERQNNLENGLKAQKEIIDTHMPRKEVEANFRGLKMQLNSIEDSQERILNKLDK